MIMYVWNVMIYMTSCHYVTDDIDVLTQTNNLSEAIIVSLYSSVLSGIAISGIYPVITAVPCWRFRLFWTIASL